MKQTQTRRRRDAGLTQCRRKADAERRRTDASQKRPEAWTQEGRRRKHQLLSSTHNIYCIWLFRSIKEIHISFLVTLLYFSRNNTLHKMEKSNKDSQIFSFRALNASASGCVRVASNYLGPITHNATFCLCIMHYWHLYIISRLPRQFPTNSDTL